MNVILVLLMKKIYISSYSISKPFENLYFQNVLKKNIAITNKYLLFIDYKPMRVRRDKRSKLEHK